MVIIAGGMWTATARRPMQISPKNPVNFMIGFDSEGTFHKSYDADAQQHIIDQATVCNSPHIGFRDADKRRIADQDC
ncbi:MAG: hypothetical protein IPP40_16075 [bacterium]|nr:hypothetical protein [bacterium]